MKFSTITFQFFQILFWWMHFRILKVLASLLRLWTRMTKGYEWWDLTITYKCTRISWLNALVHWNYEGVAAGKRSFLFPVKLRLLFVERKCSEQQNRDVFDLNLLSDRFLFTSRSILRWESFGNAWNVRSFLLSDLLVHSTAAQHLCEDFCAALFDPALSDTASAMITSQV